MKSLLWMFVLGLVMTQTSCSGDDLGPPAVEITAVGVYKLRVVGNDPLPYGFRTEISKGAVFRFLRGETLRIQADGGYRLTRIETGSQGVSYDSVGTYTIVNDTTVELSGGRRLVVSGVTATIASCIAMRPCVYVREGADAGPSLTYTLHELKTFNGGPLGVGANAPVSMGQAWVWGDGRYRRESWRSGVPFPFTDDGTFQTSGATITLSPTFGLPFPEIAPLVGTYSGGTLTLGGYGYALVTLP